MKSILSILGFLILATFSCKKEEIEFASYFPLEEGTEWCYDLYRAGESDLYRQPTWKIEGDTTLDGKVYKQLTLYSERFLAIREENNNYYNRKVKDFVNTTSEEILFLKTDNPDGATWEQIIGNWKYVFSQSVLPKLLVNGINWNEIIEVRITIFTKNSDGEFEPLEDYFNNEGAIARYDFAKGKGLISVYEPSRFNHFSDFVYQISNFMEFKECP